MVYKGNMRIKLTFSQLEKLLKMERLKCPIVFEVGDFSDKELLELSKLIQKNEC
jgi:hypothetical protein